jgi:hypothetical protein
MLPPTPPTIWDLDALLADLAAQEWAQRPVSQTYLRDAIASIRAVTGPVVNVKSSAFAGGAKGDASANDTAAIQAAHDSLPSTGGTLFFPPSLGYKHGPISISKPVSIIFSPGAPVIPIFDVPSTEKLYAITASNTTVDGLTIANVSGTISGNKYLVHVSGSAIGVKIRNSNISNITMSDGNTGLTNLIVVHGFYADSGSDLVVEKNIINFISGSALFCRNITGLKASDNHFTNTRWYTINFDSGCVNFQIDNNTIDGTDVLSRHWGGSINLMSQIGGTKNMHGRVTGNWITGKHNYGAVIRVLSAEDVTVRENHIYGCTSGTLTPGALQYIAIDRRGTAEGSPENGPCISLTVEDNHLTAGTGPQQAIYIKNQYIATRSPHLNIVVRNNQIISTDTTNYFEGGIWVSGSKAGIERVLVEGNNVVTYTVAGSPQGGAIGVVSVNITGQLKDITVINNTVRDVNTSVPNSSVQVGIFAQTFIDGLRIEGNRIENFFYGLRTLASLTNVTGLDKNTFINCINDTLFGTTSGGQTLDLSFGSALPVTGVYRTGHQRINQSAAASTSNGWQVTTAGGAMTNLFAIGATYAAGLWVRNAAGRVYQLITAGGGTTATEPSGTTVGADETAADGYTWRARSLTSARWAVLPALGAVAALP